MNFKRVLTMLLALCLIVNMAVPGVSALTAGENEYVAGQNPTASEKTAQGERINITTLKNAVQAEPAAVTEGKWTAQKVDVEADLLKAELPQGVKELREAAELYEADEVVPAFIVLEDKPLAETGVAIQAVPAQQEKAMLAQQDKLIGTISRKVLKAELDVRYQFTYLSNAITANVPFGALAEIAELPGVKTVFLMPVYDKCETVNTATAGDMIGVPSIWEELGYTGEGMKIAIVDTGLDLDHPSFAAAPAVNEDSLTVEDIEKVFAKLNATELYPAATAEDLYQSAKVPFAFNYVDENLRASHDYDQQGDHGSHVAGIAAANRCEGTTVVGVAPDAQVVVMKVFGANGGAYQDDLMAAIEDALLLDVDVINMSLGATSGFSSEDPELDAIYGRVEYFDTILTISAGNETQSSYSNIWGTDQNPTKHPDSAVVGSPSTWGGAISVASAENDHVYSTYFTVDGEGYGYTDALGLNVEFRSLAGQELEYVMIPGLGEEADFEGLDVTGKIAVISRGQINFSLKLYNAEQAGAAGVIIYNNEPGSIGLQMTDEEGNLNDGITGNTPCVSVAMTTGAALAAAENKVLTVSSENGPVVSADGGQMSLFSSWGVTPSLELKPEITAIGGNMYSCYDHGRYGLMSGTSMSAPQMAGVSALVLQYLGDNYPDLADAEERDIAHALMMSTAEPIIANASGLEASPRQQGAGLVNAAAALASEAYLSVKGEDKPKAELGDDPSKTGVYSFVFDIHNISDEAQSYELDFSLLTEDIVSDYVQYGLPEFMAGWDRELTGEVTFSRDTVEVAPNGHERVEVTVKLSAEDMLWMDEHYANGIYVEGFVYAKNTAGSGVDLSLPFLGFYGDWTAAPNLDEGFWYQGDFWGYYNPEPTANQYFHTVWTDLAGTDWVLGFNPYTGLMVDENGTVLYDAANNVISPNGDGVLDYIPEIYVSLMRNAKTLDFTFTDALTGEVYFQSSDVYARKTSFSPAYGQIVPYLYTWYHEPWNFTGKDGKPLANNTRLNLTIATTGDYDVHTENLNGDSIVIPITIDTQAPELLKLEAVSEANANYLVLTVAENVNIADTFIANPSNTRILAEQPVSVNNGDGTFTVTMDVTGLGNDLLLFLADYGANESSYKITFEGDDNLPELADGTVYAYRVMDASYTDDTLYGWVTIDPETAEVTTLTSDYMEMYALTAAEYAGGYIFAVDAGYNLVAMVPGLFNRIDICNLGISVADMTFDPTTNTMYMVGKVDYTNKLLKLDLATGEYEVVCGLGSGSVYSIECDDQGNLYAIKGASAKLWKMNWETQTLEAVMDFTSGEYPYYSQSMTFDRENNCLYWAYCTYMAEGFAIYTIDLDTMTYTKADFANQSEYVGLLMVEDSVTQAPCDGESCPSEKFVDVQIPSWYHEGVDFVVDKGCMVGTSATTFSPAQTINRAMVITTLYSLAGSPETSGESTFTDVQAGSFYEKPVIWAAENGIANGKSADSFAPADLVTRQELVTFLYRFAGYMGIDTAARYDSLASYADADTLDIYAVQPMKWAVGNGIISGVDETHLAPMLTSNRAQLAVLLKGLYNKVLGVYTLPVGELAGLKIAPERILMPVGGSQELTVTPDPWNAKLGDVAFASTDDSVATVSADGVVTGVAGGVCEIVAVCGELTASVPVRILDVQGSVKAYNYYSNSLEYGSWIDLDLASLDVTYGETSPVDFIAADYNGHENVIYGYDANYTFYAWDLQSGDVQVIGSAGNKIQVTDMAYDYSSGIMYAVGVDTSTYAGYIFQVDVRTGKLLNAAMSSQYLPYFGLAIDMEGNIYVLDVSSNLHRVTIEEGMDGMTGELVRYAVEELVIETGFGDLNYTQSMCYDHINDQIIWAACGAYSTIFWMDPATGDFLELGAPGGDNFFEFMGMHTVPTEIPELPVVALESAELPESLVVMMNGSKAAPLNIYPLNATIESIVWASADETIATVDQNGTVTGVGLGETEITVTITVGEEIITDTMTVTVMASGDNLYAFILTDFATMGGLAWAEVFDTAPETPEYLAMTDWTIEAAEYVNGKIYAYGYDSYSWEDTSRYLFTIDPETFEIVETVNTGMELFVYDMSYDYTTGTMYALASYNNDGGADLYMVDLNTGKLILSHTLDKFFLSIAFDENGTLYAIDESEMEEDPFTWEVTVADAGLYTIDPATGSYELVGSTGLKNNMYCSMTFDYDTGNLYWNTCYRQDFWSPVEAKFCVVDHETGAATDLGFLGAAGSQISALIAIADEYPASPEPTLNSIIIEEKLHVMGVGDTAEVAPILIHPSCAAEITYVSSDEAVATVDENGVITAVAPGSAEITATATDGITTVSDTTRVAVFSADASMMAFETGSNTWSTIARMDPTNVTSVSEVQDTVLAAAYVGDTIYGYDAAHNFFKVEGDGFTRTIIGNTGLELGAAGEIGVDYLDIRGMAYDPAGERLLVLGAKCVPQEGWIDEYVGQTTIYEVNLENGNLTAIVAINENVYNVRGMAVDGDGVVYVYSAFDDYFSAIDLTDGSYTHKCTLQSLGIYASADFNMPMAYDAVTGLVYCLFTSNGGYHMLLSFNPLTAQVKNLGNVGEVVYNEDVWAYGGPTFSALLIK